MTTRLATTIVAALALVWTLVVGSLAVARHENLRTNAFDLGYFTQTLWNTAHGEPYRLTVLEGATFQPEGLDPARIRRPHSYLAFHVEPVLPLVAAFYALWADPRFLLWLQAAVIAFGAVPISWLAAAVLAGPAADPRPDPAAPSASPSAVGHPFVPEPSRLRSTVPVLFGVAYLLAPGLEGAALSDVHLVALAATWLAFGLWLLESGRVRWALFCFALAALSREDAALLTAWLGLVLASQPRHRRTGLILAGAAGLWTAICFGLIAPYFNGGGSLFWSRYQWLGPTPARALLATLTDPRPLLAWLVSPDVASYLALQLLTGGVVCLLAPLQLLATAPLLTMNALSSFDWMRSGGAHYSALLVPMLLWSAAHGVRRLPGLAAPLVLVGGLGAHLWIGVSPLRPGFVWPSSDPRAASALGALAAIPPDAAVSASSDLYPHLANRHRLYWFPAREDATWLALDAIGTSHPLTPAELHERTIELLGTGDYAVEAAQSGVLVLRAGTGGLVARERLLDAARSPDAADQIEELLPESFDAFADVPEPATLDPRPSVAFGDALELVDWRLRRWPQVTLFGDAGTLETVWRAAAPSRQQLRFALVSVRRSDGAIVGVQPDPAPGALWLPTTRWRPGRLYRFEMPIDRLGGLGALGIAVLDPSGRRLPIRAPADVTLWEDGTIARLVAGL